MDWLVDWITWSLLFDWSIDWLIDWCVTHEPVMTRVSHSFCNKSLGIIPSVLVQFIPMLLRKLRIIQIPFFLFTFCLFFFSYLVEWNWQEKCRSMFAGLLSFDHWRSSLCVFILHLDSNDVLVDVIQSKFPTYSISICDVEKMISCKKKKISRHQKRYFYRSWGVLEWCATAFIRHQLVHILLREVVQLGIVHTVALTATQLAVTERTRTARRGRGHRLRSTRGHSTGHHHTRALHHSDTAPTSLRGALLHTAVRKV